LRIKPRHFGPGMQENEESKKAKDEKDYGPWRDVGANGDDDEWPNPEPRNDKQKRSH
jgi:hypothetical protein